MPALTNAVATAPEGGVVEIAASTYLLDEAMTFADKKFTLRGATGNFPPSASATRSPPYPGPLPMA